MSEQATLNESLTAPGRVLRAAREAAGLSQSDVAQKLRMSRQSIKDIECDEYSHFSAVIYVSGYIRNYASLLHLDSKPLLQAFYEMGFAEEVKSIERVNTSTLMTGVHRAVMVNRSKNHMARWASLLILAILVSLVGFWWYGQHHHQHAIPQMNTAKSQAKTTNASGQLPLTVHQSSARHRR